MRFNNGALIADNEDYTIPVNELVITEVDNLVVFRCLTENGQLFGAAVDKHEPSDVILSTGQLVVMRAGTADTTPNIASQFIEVVR